MVTLAGTDIKPANDWIVVHARQSHAPRQQLKSAARALENGSMVDLIDPGRPAQRRRAAQDGGFLVARNVDGESNVSMLFLVQNHDLNLFILM